jgi:hypothetical protein
MKSFYQMSQLIESMDVRVQDAEYNNPLATLGDLSWYLIGKLQDSLFKKLTPEQADHFKKNMTPEIIAVDGDGYFKNSGILNVYLSAIPTELHEKLKKAIIYFLEDIGAEYKPPYVDKSKSLGVDTLRVPITKIQPPRENPPELNLSNGNAHHIFGNVLGFHDAGGGYILSARDILIKIDMYNQELADFDARLPTKKVSPGGAQFISFGLSGDQIKQRLDLVRNIAKWAIDNNYDTIQVF